MYRSGSECECGKEKEPSEESFEWQAGLSSRLSVLCNLLAAASHCYHKLPQSSSGGGDGCQRTVQ